MPCDPWFADALAALRNGADYSICGTELIVNTGAKPDAVCRWLFEMVGADPDADDLYDLYPGTGAVAEAWNSWKSQLVLGAANSQQRTET